MSSISKKLMRLASALALSCFLVAATAQGAELSAPAQEPYQKGMRAAQERDWTAAQRYFREAQKLDPDAPEIWFNLGLASSKIPGYEIRAIALFKAYLLENPGAANAAAIASQIAALQRGFESKATQIVDRLESLLLLQKEQDSNLFTDWTGWYLASARYFLGDGSGAARTIVATRGEKWREKWRESQQQGGSLLGSSEDSLVVSMAAAGLLDEAVSMARESSNPEPASFALEQGDTARAEKFLSAGAPQGWSTIACQAYYRNDNGRLSDALSKARTELDNVMAFGSCERELWWSVGRLAYLLRLGTEGVVLNTSYDETQLGKFVKSYPLDETHQGHVTSNLASVAFGLEKICREYRKLHGPKSARDDYAEAYFYRGNLHYNEGRFDRAVRDYDQAIRLGWGEAASNRERALAELERPAGPGAVSAPPASAPAAGEETLADEVLRQLKGLDDYRELQALYDGKVAQAGWVASDEGAAVKRRLEMIRADAARPAIVGNILYYTVRGQEIKDSGILIADLKTDRSYFEFIGHALALNILSDPMDPKVQGALDRYRALRKYRAFRLPPAAATPR